MYSDRIGSDKVGYQIIFGSSDIMQGEGDLITDLWETKCPLPAIKTHMHLNFKSQNTICKSLRAFEYHLFEKTRDDCA